MYRICTCSCSVTFCSPCTPLFALVPVRLVARRFYSLVLIIPDLLHYDLLLLLLRRSTTTRCTRRVLLLRVEEVLQAGMLLLLLRGAVACLRGVTLEGWWRG